MVFGANQSLSALFPGYRIPRGWYRHGSFAVDMSRLFGKVRIVHYGTESDDGGVRVGTEQDNSGILYEEPKSPLESDAIDERYDFEFVWVEDGSSDHSVGVSGAGCSAVL